MLMQGALEGVKVLDLSSVIMGPMAAQHLGDMGADVIKVEAPEGDITRSMGPCVTPRMGAFFLGYNRNKRSIVLDLKRPRAREVLHRLVAQADVLIHSIRNPAAVALGLSYESLVAVNSGLIHAHLKGFADGGPYQDQPAFDDIIQSVSGLAMLQTVVGGEPRYVPTCVADKVCGLHAAYGVAIALVHKFRTGRGQEMKFSMFETMAAFNLSEHLWGHIFEAPKAPIGYPSVRAGVRRPCPTKDGYLAFLPYSDAHWIAFFRIAGRDDLIANPEFATFAGRQRNWEAVFDVLVSELRRRTTAEWMAVLQDQDIPLSPVNTLEDLLVDPQLQACGFWETLDHPTEGRLRSPMNPIGLVQTPPAVRRMAPLLGEHTREVLADLAFSDTEAAGLIASHAAVPLADPEPLARAT